MEPCERHPDCLCWKCVNEPCLVDCDKCDDVSGTVVEMCDLFQPELECENGTKV